MQWPFEMRIGQFRETLGVHLRVPRRTLTLTLCAAVVGLAAACVSFAARKHLDDDLASLVGDVVNVVLVVLVLGLVTAWVTESQRVADQRASLVIQEAATRARVARLSLLSRLAANAWNALPTDDVSSGETPGDAASSLRTSAVEMRGLYTEILTLYEARLTNDEELLVAFLQSADLASALRLYAAEGMRTRRFERLDRIASELRELADDPDPGWADRVQRFRSAAFNALGWRSHTDAVIVERLIVEKVVDLSAYPRPAEASARSLRTALDMDSLAASVEPLWLIVGYLAIHCADLRPDKLPSRTVLDVIRRPLGSLRNEVFMIAAAYDALADVLDHAALRPHGELASANRSAVALGPERPATPGLQASDTWRAPGRA